MTCRAFVVAYRDVLTEPALTYQAWCRVCGYEGTPTLNDTVAMEQTKAHNQQEGTGE